MHAVKNILDNMLLSWNLHSEDSLEHIGYNQIY